MTDYPGAIYTPRTKENKPGIAYDADKEEIGYAEDITKLDDEVVAIETELGTNPKGVFASVKAWLETLNAHLSATGASHSYIDQDVSSSSTPSFAHLIVGGRTTSKNFLLTEPSINYEFGARASGGDPEPYMAVRPTAISSFSFDMFNNPGTDAGALSTFFTCWRVGTPLDLNPGEYVQFMANGATKEMLIRSGKVGTGTVRPLILYTGANTNQLYVDTDGQVGIGKVPTVKLDVSGAIASATLNLAVSTDDLDVSGVNIIFLTMTEDIVVGGFSGGVNGQTIHVAYKGDGTDKVTFEEQEPDGEQKFFMHTGADEDIKGGGWTFVCDGVDWYDVSHAKHV